MRKSKSLDPEANFYDTQRAFERYWCGRTNHKGNGWKVFKRWEYINQFRVQPDGKLPEPGSVAREYEKYTSSHSPKSISLQPLVDGRRYLLGLNGEEDVRDAGAHRHFGGVPHSHAHRGRGLM